MMKNQKIGSPIIPRNKSDPTQSGRQVRKMFRDIDNRYYELKKALKQLFDLSFTGREKAQSPTQSYILAKNAQDEPDTIFKVNASAYIYDLAERPTEYAKFLERLQSILDDYLLEGGDERLWAFGYVSDEYERGTLNAYTNLAVQSEVYAQQTTLTYLLSQPAYQNQVAAAFISTYSDWRGLSDAARTDLANVIGTSIARGINPRETARIVSQRLDVSMTRAKAIAQTEQVGALRRANWNETAWASERLGLKTGILWISALKPTTRPSHAARSGKIFTVEEVEYFYSINGNRYNCYCGNQPVLLNEDGTLHNHSILDRLTKSRDEWLSESGSSVSKLIDDKYTPPVYEAQKNVTRVNQWASGNIAEIAKIPAGSNIEQLNECVGLIHELQDRFSLDKLRYIGTMTGDTHKYAQSKGMVAGYAHQTKAMLVTRKAFDAQDLIEVDKNAKAYGFTKSSLEMAQLHGNENIINAIKNTEISWQAVPTPRGVFAHEYGHVLHRAFPDKIDKVGMDAYKNGWQYAISKYGQSKYTEYIAEAFSLYIEDIKEAEKRIYPPLLQIFKDMDKTVK